MSARARLATHATIEITHLREELARMERERDQVKRQHERRKQQLDAARRAGFRQAAPFAKTRRQGHGGQPGRRAGPDYGRRARRPIPAQVQMEYRRARWIMDRMSSSKAEARRRSVAHDLGTSASTAGTALLNQRPFSERFF